MTHCHHESSLSSSFFCVGKSTFFILLAAIFSEPSNLVRLSPLNTGLEQSFSLGPGNHPHRLNPMFLLSAHFMVRESTCACLFSCFLSCGQLEQPNSPMIRGRPG